MRKTINEIKRVTTRVKNIELTGYEKARVTGSVAGIVDNFKDAEDTAGLINATILSIPNVLDCYDILKTAYSRSKNKRE